MGKIPFLKYVLMSFISSVSPKHSDKKMKSIHWTKDVFTDLCSHFLHRSKNTMIKTLSEKNVLYFNNKCHCLWTFINV